jgi:tetratricopeptide (TPR) repeat protein
MTWASLPAITAVFALVGGTWNSDGLTAAQEAPRQASAVAAEWRARGLEYGYNLDRAEAIDAFERAIDADPGSPAAYRLLAATAWVGLLFEQGAITVDDFLGEARANYRRSPPEATLARVFHDALARAMALSDERLRARPDDADAYFHVGAGYGFQAAYAATIEGRLRGSLGPARRAYRAHSRVLELDPARADAGLIVGMYRSAVSALSMPLRLGAYLAGFGGGRELGLRLVEEAAAHPSDVRSNAQFTLIVMYSREARYDDALRVIRDLQRQFPRNRLLWLEEGTTALRAGRAGEARKALEDGLARLALDRRPRAPGEEARWRYAYGAALVATGAPGAADRELRAALDLATRDWVRGRIHTELGKLADLAGNRAHALALYRQADRLCRGDDDEMGARAARALIPRRHQ